MSTSPQDRAASRFSLERRELLKYAAAFGPAFLAAQGLAKADDAASPSTTTRQYPFKKSINL